jgi:hypothetical protein
MSHPNGAVAARAEHERLALERNIGNPAVVRRTIRYAKEALARGLIAPEDLGLPAFNRDEIAEAGMIAARLDARIRGDA